MNIPGLHDIEQRVTSFSIYNPTYRYYARRTPGQGWPAVYCGDIDGPNCYCYGTYRTMLQAHVIAWWRNRRRGYRTCGSTRFRRAVPHEHNFPLSTGVCECGAAHPTLGPGRIISDLTITSYGPQPPQVYDQREQYPATAEEAFAPPQGFAADADPPYGHDCGPDCTCFDLPGPFDPDSPPAPGYVLIRMMPGDLFTYRGPAWDVEAGCPEEFVDPLAGPTDKLHLKVVWEYADFIVATEIKHPEQYIIPKRLGTISNRTPKEAT